MHNLLTDPIIRTCPLGFLTLPGVLAALSRDEIDSYPAMRPHQGMFWHMFCVQLSAMAIKGNDDIPRDEATWRHLLRAMTPGHPDDAPWSLVVDDWTKPAFMQAAVPDGVRLEDDVLTPDALDMLITAKNHDLKQTTAIYAATEDWLFALVTLQTGEGYGGRGNQGIARMNGGNSSRALVGLSPIAGGRTKSSPGAWFSRDVMVLQHANDRQQNLGFKVSGGLGLIWLASWPEEDQLQLFDLDQHFIEICRRVRLSIVGDNIVAKKGNSKATRVNAKHLKGAIGDPWAPVHKTENKALTLGEDGDFDYGRIMEIMFSGNWEGSLLSRPAAFETPDTQLLLVAQALARGNSKTGGFRRRDIPVAGKIAAAFGLANKRQKLHEIGKEQAELVKEFRSILGYGLVLAVAQGNVSQIKREHYAYAKTAQSELDRYADSIFFSFLWLSFEGDKTNVKVDFIQQLWRKTQSIFERFLPMMPVGSLVRPKAEAQARSALYGRVMKNYSEFLRIEEVDANVTRTKEAV